MSTFLVRLTAPVFLVLVPAVVLASAPQGPGQRLDSLLEQVLSTDTLPNDPDLDWAAITSSLDTLVAASPGHPTSVLAQRAAFRLRVTTGRAIFTVGDSVSAQLASEPRLKLSGAWAFRADVDAWVEPRGWISAGWFSGIPGCKGWIRALPNDPGVHRLDLRIRLTFFPRSAARAECAGTLVVPSGPGPAPVTALDPDAVPVWQDLRYEHVTYAFANRQLQRGQLPDELTVAGRVANVATLEPGLPEMSFEQWLRAATGRYASGPVEWTTDYCRYDERSYGALCAQALVMLDRAHVTRLITRLRVGEISREGKWNLIAPAFHTAFVTSDGDSLDIKSLAEIPSLVSMPHNDWPLVDIGIDSRDITYTLPPPVPGQADPVLAVSVVVHNIGLRDAHGVDIRVVVGCDDGASGHPGGDVEARHDVVKQVTRDVPAIQSTTFAWSLVPPCRTPWIVVQAFYMPLSDDPWKALPIWDPKENNFAGLQVGTGVRFR